MYDFALFVDAYLRKISINRVVDAVDPLYLLCEAILSNSSQSQLTIFRDKSFSDKEYATAFNQSYCRLYIENLVVAKSTNGSYALQVTHNPRIKDYSRAVEIVIELSPHGAIKSSIRTLRGSDTDLWYFLIQLADFSVVAKFKHQSGIPV